MFKKFLDLFNAPNIPVNDPDPSLGYSRLEEFKAHLIGKQYDHFESKYDQLLWDEKTLLNEGIGTNEYIHLQIIEWVNLKPESWLAHLFAGVSYTKVAWIKRSGARAKEVSESQFEAFSYNLEKAYDHLQKADEIKPGEAEVYARMIRVYMGMNATPEATWSYFEAAKNVEPNHLMAHLMYINYITPKWHGSIEEMHDFADSIMKQSSNNQMVVLKLFAFTEEWLYYSMNDEMEKHSQFFSQTELGEQILSLYRNYKESDEGRLLIPIVRNYFTFLLWCTGFDELAKAEGKKITGKMIIFPWNYIGINNNRELQQLLQ